MEPSLYGTSWWLQQLPQKKPHPQSNVQWDHIIAAVEGPAHCQALHEDSKLSMWRGILLLGWYEGTRHRVICLTMNCPSNLSIPIHWQAFPSIWIKLKHKQRDLVRRSKFQKVFFQKYTTQHLRNAHQRKTMISRDCNQGASQQTWTAWVMMKNKGTKSFHRTWLVGVDREGLVKGKLKWAGHMRLKYVYSSTWCRNRNNGRL